MRLHHIAYVTKNLDRKVAELQRVFGIQKVAEPVIDTLRRVRIVFLDLGSTQLELLEPLGPDSPVAARAQKAPGLFHLCFEVDDLEEALRQVQATGEATVINEPAPAPAIDDRRVAFVVSAGNDLIEFVERSARGG